MRTDHLALSKPRIRRHGADLAISIDEPETIEAWRTFLKKEHIPWRSLLSVNVEEVRRKFMVPGIPHAILVFPNKECKALNLWEKTDQEQLYK